MSFDRLLRVLNNGGIQRADFHVLILIDIGHGSVTAMQFDDRLHRDFVSPSRSINARNASSPWRWN